MLDGAYAEYCDPQTIRPVLILLNSTMFDHTHIFQGLWAGGIAAGLGLLPARYRQCAEPSTRPFNINQPAMAAGLVALEDQGHIEASRSHNAHWREWLVQQLAALVSVRASFVNFILVEFDSDQQAAAAEAFLCARRYSARPHGLWPATCFASEHRYGSQSCRPCRFDRLCC